MAVISRARIRELMEMACAKNNIHADFASRIRVEWNDRFTARMGDANYSKMRMRLSTPLFIRAFAEEQENTVVHEMCHIIALHKFGRGIKSHGGEWQACMIIAGYEPTRCHDVDTTGLTKTRKTFPTVCGCDKLHLVTQKVWLKIAQGSKYTCRRCKQWLQLAKVG